MSDLSSVEPFGEHYFLVRGEESGDAVATRFYVDPGFMERLQVPGATEAEVVRASLSYLLRYQRIDELPPQLDLDDVAAAYDEFDDHLRSTLTSTHE
jgi:hypothetical protein